MTTVDVKKLLSLSKKERKKIAEKLWHSLRPEKKEEENVVKLLEKRWKNIQAGKSAVISSNTFWKNMDAYLQQKGK